MNSIVNMTAGFLFILLMVIGCASTGGTSGPDSSDTHDKDSVVHVDNPSLSIVDHLRRIPGVRIVGDGPNAQITIRGKQTFESNSSPLFVINGRRAGKNFASVYYLVSPSDIKTIEVLKGTDTSLYGMDGANGVVLITTR